MNIKMKKNSFYLLFVLLFFIACKGENAIDSLSTTDLNGAFLFAGDSITNLKTGEALFGIRENVSDMSYAYSGVTLTKSSYFLANISNTRISAYNMSDNKLRWSYSLQTQYNIVADDKVACVASGNSLVCMDIITGQKKWQYNAGTLTRQPVIAGNNIYVEISGKGVAALDLNTGLLQRIYSEQASEFRPIIIGDTLFYVSYKGSLLAYNTKTGLLTWELKLESNVPSSQMAYSEGVIFCRIMNLGSVSKLFAINGANGKKIWEKNLNDTRGYLTVDKGLLCYSERVNINKTKLTVVDAVTGIQKWTYETDVFVDNVHALLVEKSLIYVENNILIKCLNAENGQLKWQKDWRIQPFCPSVITKEGKIYHLPQKGMI